MDQQAALDARVRAAVYDAVIADGVPPAVTALATALSLQRAEVAAALERLAAGRVLVLQPTSREVLMAFPFSAVPTSFSVSAGGRRYFANCIWDALGIPAMLGCDARLECSCGCCGDAIEATVVDGALGSLDAIVHFAVPARRWWEDIVFS